MSTLLWWPRTARSLIATNAPLFVVFLVFFGAGFEVGMSTNAALTLLCTVTDDAKLGGVGLPTSLPEIKGSHLVQRSEARFSCLL